MPLENPDSARASLVARAKDALLGPDTGASVIGRYAKTAPAGPGVYRMIDASGEVLYVGKARHLKKRVQSYARAGSHNNRIVRMIADTASMEFVTTATEIEALLLEANLIKRLKPRFNVVLRDDKSFPFILISRDHRVPQILKHRGARNAEGEYFGPFASAGAVGRTINTLQRAFLLRSCSDAYYESRVQALPIVSNQALQRAVHRRDLRRGLRRAGRRGARLPARRERRGEAKAACADGRGEPEAGL